MEQGKFLRPIEPLGEYLKQRGIAWTYFRDAPSLRLLEDQPEHGCDLCSRYRRRAVYEIARELGANVIAFGHTADDFCEALLRNTMFTGKLSALPPVTHSRDREFRLIRPLVFVTEDITRAYAESLGVPVVPCGCSQTHRHGAALAARHFRRTGARVSAPEGKHPLRHGQRGYRPPARSALSPARGTQPQPARTVSDCHGIVTATIDPTVQYRLTWGSLDPTHSMRLLPREEKFYDLFLKQVEIISEAARLLLDGVRAGNARLAGAATEISVLEHRGDEVIHEVFTRLNQTFITPLDPEDIHNHLGRAGQRAGRHRRHGAPPGVVPHRSDSADMVQLAEIVASCAKALKSAFEALEKERPSWSTASRSTGWKTKPT